jgi:beta-lactamase regulating signal transducer with metallopeptidase domain
MSRLAFADVLLRDAAGLLIVKATLVLTLANVAAAVMRSCSAARRHTLWLITLLSCVWLALSSSLLPAIMIRTPMLAQKVVGAAVPPNAAVAPVLRSATSLTARRVRERFPSAQAARRPHLSIPLPSHPLIALWIVGCVALVVRHAIGFVGATRLARRASLANDDETTRELARVATALGVTREVRLSYSTEVQTPITFTIAKPHLLLPTEAKSWSIERRRAVLVHEAAHVARGDWLSQVVGHLACELFWFHPLVWRAFARLRDEAERAADDCVLRSGMPAFEYATHLLELAKRTTNARPEVLAIGIVSTNDLERRFVAMFDRKRSRTNISARARAITTSFAFAIVCPLASLRVGAPPQRPSSPQPHAARLHTSTPRPTSAKRRGPADGDPAHVARAVEIPAAIVRQPAPETPLSSVAVVEREAPTTVRHPDLSGKWKSDTVANPIRYQDFFATDSSIIRQSADSISFESHSRILNTVGPIYNRLHNITFDGAESSGVGFSGWQSKAANVVASALWVGDTLVLTTRVYNGGHVFHTIERMRLGADGNVLFVTNTSFVDGNVRWGGPYTFVLRRLAP